MTDHTPIDAARRQLFAVLEEALADIGRRRFKQQSPVRRLKNRLVHLVTRPVALTVTTDRLTFDYDPYRDRVVAVSFDGATFDLRDPGDSEVSLVAAYPEALDGVTTAITDLWTSTFERSCPYTTRLGREFQALEDAITAARATATLEEVVRAIREDRQEVVELLFDVDHPIADQPDSELAAVFDQPLQTVLYQDEDIALLLPEREMVPTWRGGIVSIRQRPREAFVVGRDDTPTGFFVHPVDGTHLTGATNVTRQDINDVLGFDRELAAGTSELDPPRKERLRVQGDLCLERRRTARELREWFAARFRDEIERAVTDEFSDRFLRERDLADYRGQIQIAGHGTELQVDVERSERGAEAVAAIERRFIASRRSQVRSQQRHLAQYRRASQRLERRLTSYFAAHDDEYTETVARRLRRRVEAALDGCGQLNLPIDNHLVLLGNARLHPDETGEQEPVRVLVPDRTSLHVVHDEHPQVDVQLTPGEYSFQLLDRGVQPEAERPQW